MARRKRRNLAGQVGHSPGAIVAPPDAPATSIRLVRFDAQRCDVREQVSVVELPKLLAEHSGVAWVDVVGFGTVAVFEKLRDLFSIPHLAIADVVAVPHRPRLEIHQEGTLAILRVPRPSTEVDLDQVSFWGCPKALVSFREHEDGLFDPVLARLRDPKSRLRISGADYLYFRLVDVAIDSSFPHLERLAERLDAIENVIVERPTSKPLSELYLIRRDCGLLLRAALPSRDVLAGCGRESGTFLTPAVQPSLRNAHDHAAQAADLAEHLRVVAGEIQELIVANLDLRMNRIMKVLTAVTVIFIPLSFITGVYGMNFEFMPELHWRLGYPLVLLALLLVAAWIAWRLKRAGWMRLDSEE